MRHFDLAVETVVDSDTHECHLQYREDEILRKVSANRVNAVFLRENTVWPAYIWLVTVSLGFSASVVLSFTWSNGAPFRERVITTCISLGIALLSAMLCLGFALSGVESWAGMLFVLAFLAFVSYVILNLSEDAPILDTALAGGLYGTIIVLAAYPLSVVGQVAGERWERRKWTSEAVVTTIVTGLYEISQGLRSVERFADHDRRRERRHDLVNQIDDVAWLLENALPHHIADGNEWVRQELASRAQTIRNWKAQILLPIDADSGRLRSEIIHVMAHSFKGEWGAISKPDSPHEQTSWFRRLQGQGSSS